MPQRIIGALIIVCVFAYVMNWRTKRRKAQVWNGRVSEVRHQRPSVPDDKRRAEDWVTVCYRTDEGKDGMLKMRCTFFQNFYGTLTPGERLIKVEGAYMPKKESMLEPAAGEDSSAA